MNRMNRNADSGPRGQEDQSQAQGEQRLRDRHRRRKCEVEFERGERDAGDVRESAEPGSWLEDLQAEP